MFSVILDLEMMNKLGHPARSNARFFSGAKILKESILYYNQNE